MIVYKQWDKYVPCIAVLKIIPYSIINRIKCHTKTQTKQMLFFSTMKTFVINDKSYSCNKIICFI